MGTKFIDEICMVSSLMSLKKLYKETKGIEVTPKTLMSAKN